MNVKRIGWILLAVAGVSLAVFIVCLIVTDPAESNFLWGVFSVCIPVTGVCFTGAAIAAVIDHIKKR